MPDVLITKIPVGEAPLSVREAWVGLILPIAQDVDEGMEYTTGVLTGSLTPVRPCFSVEISKAIAVLQKHRPQAAAWWKELYRRKPSSSNLLIFNLSEGRLIQNPSD